MKDSMRDMGMTSEERYGSSMAMDSESMKDKKQYETIMMTSDKMPKGMEDMHAGETCKVCVEMLVKSVEKEEGGKTKYKLEMRKMGMMPEEKKEINPYKKSHEM